MPGLDTGSLRHRIRIEQPVPDDSLDGAGSGSWKLVAEVWASVTDALPSRGERLAEGINVATRPARVRMRFRTDVTAAMRFVLDGRVMQIVAGPAEIGWKDGLEFMVEEYGSAGNGA
jgi:head-tail adaptor